MQTLTQQLSALSAQNPVFSHGYQRIIGVVNRLGITAAIDAVSPLISYDPCPAKREAAQKAMAVLREHESRTYSCEGMKNYPHFTF